MKKWIFALIVCVLAVPAFATVAYTKENLNAMYSKGKLPKLGPAVTIDETLMDFSDCRNKGNETYTSSQRVYPAKIIIDSGVLYTLKIWKESALLVINCSRTDGKRTITQANYQ